MMVYASHGVSPKTFGSSQAPTRPAPRGTAARARPWNAPAGHEATRYHLPAGLRAVDVEPADEERHVDQVVVGCARRTVEGCRRRSRGVEERASLSRPPPRASAHRRPSPGKSRLAALRIQEHVGAVHHQEVAAGPGPRVVEVVGVVGEPDLHRARPGCGGCARCRSRSCPRPARRRSAARRRHGHAWRSWRSRTNPGSTTGGRAGRRPARSTRKVRGHLDRCAAWPWPSRSAAAYWISDTVWAASGGPRGPGRSRVSSGSHRSKIRALTRA